MAARDSVKPSPDVLYPTIDEGVRGLAFIGAAIRSSNEGGIWLKV